MSQQLTNYSQNLLQNSTGHNQKMCIPIFLLDNSGNNIPDGDKSRESIRTRISRRFLHIPLGGERILFADQEIHN